MRQGRRGSEYEFGCYWTTHVFMASQLLIHTLASLKGLHQATIQQIVCPQVDYLSIASCLPFVKFYLVRLPIPAHSLSCIVDLMTQGQRTSRAEAKVQGEGRGEAGMRCVETNMKD